MSKISAEELNYILKGALYILGGVFTSLLGVIVFIAVKALKNIDTLFKRTEDTDKELKYLQGQHKSNHKGKK